ncbi:MAG: zonular occludens toxin domain-containing protein [Methylococcales bacterium]|nr:zonular occludens toxin domain-containing protein [Methylococcales bacterium]
MITLITGTPGSGKSIYAVWHEIKPAVEAGRIVYSCGIPNLKLPAIPLSDDQARDWYKTIPKSNDDDPDESPVLSTIAEGSMIVIDEVQRLWRPTGAGSVSPDIAALETHRHHGLDFIVITQHPSLLHRNVRALVGRHIHLRATALGNYLYEFPEWCENPQTKSARTNCVRTRYRLPKAAFELYKSASLHVKTSKRKPIQYFVFMAVLLAVPVAGYSFVQSIVDRTKPAQVVASGPGLPSDPVSSFTATPALDSHRYLDVRLVSNQVDWSQIAACVSGVSKCLCYGDSGQRLAVPVAVCNDAVKFGWGGRYNAIDKPAEHGTRTKDEDRAEPASLSLPGNKPATSA